VEVAACEAEGAEQLAKEITARAAASPKKEKALRELRELRAAVSDGKAREDELRADLEASKLEAEEAKRGWAESERELDTSLSQGLIASKGLKQCQDEQAAAAIAQTADSSSSKKKKPRPSKHGGTADGGELQGGGSGSGQEEEAPRSSVRKTPCLSHFHQKIKRSVYQDRLETNIHRNLEGGKSFSAGGEDARAQAGRAHG
jgi:hypothetical protein